MNKISKLNKLTSKLNKINLKPKRIEVLIFDKEIRNIYNSIFDDKQKEVFRFCIDNNIDICKINNLFSYDGHQLDQIIKGRLYKLDTTIYEDNNLTYKQMEQIKLGLLHNIDVTEYAKKCYTAKQMEQLRLGKEHRIDITPLLDPDMSVYKMDLLRTLLEYKVDITPYMKNDCTSNVTNKIINTLLDDIIRAKYGLEPNTLNRVEEPVVFTLNPSNKNHLNSFISGSLNYNLEQLRQLAGGHLAGINVKLYEDSRYNSKQMKIIKECMMYGLDFYRFIDYSISYKKMELIQKGLLYNLNVSTFSGMNLTTMQMHQILTGLYYKVDVSKFNHTLLHPSAMREVALGLIHGVDISGYAMHGYDSHELENIRKLKENELGCIMFIPLLTED